MHDSFAFPQAGSSDSSSCLKEGGGGEEKEKKEDDEEGKTMLKVQEHMCSVSIQIAITTLPSHIAETIQIPIVFLNGPWLIS